MTAEERIYCLEFEVTTLSGVVNRGELERWTPGFCGEHTEREHVKRYQWVGQFVKGKDVLDMACGVGAGSLMMRTAGGAKNITGVDLSGAAIKYASIKNRHPDVTFVEADGTRYTSDRKFDVVVSFETIEHVPDAVAFIGNVHAALADGGLFIVSTPISAVVLNERPDNRYHVREWGFRAFQEFISKKFTVERVFVQVTGVRQSRLERLTARVFGRARQPGFSYEPVPWDGRRHPVDDMGRKISAYQILVCRKG